MPFLKLTNPFDKQPVSKPIDPFVLDFFAKKLSDAGIPQKHTTTAAYMFGRWHNQKNELVSIAEEADIYGITPKTAKRIWDVIANTFELEMKYVEDGEDPRGLLYEILEVNK